MRTPDCTVVCCIESGDLEAMSLRLIESLRRHGGRLATCPVVAVSARRGPRLSPATRHRLAALSAEHLRTATSDPYAWYHFLNKARALEAVEDQVSSELMVFLDSDVLVVAEPGELLLEPHVDFAATPEEGSIESTGEGDDYEPLWSAFAVALGLELSALPWVESQTSSRATRYYVNSGVFSYRRQSRLALTYLNTALRLLDARTACRRSGIHWIEQAALGLAVTQLGLRWKSLDSSHNYGLNAWGKGLQNGEVPFGVRLLHYHNCMREESWADFLSWLDSRFPRKFDWLRREGPLRDPALPHRRLLNLAQRLLWGFRRRRFLAGCQLV